MLDMESEFLKSAIIFLFLLFQEYTLTDDTVLEEHYEDPRLTQMNLLGGRSGMLIKTDYDDMFLLKLVVRAACVAKLNNNEGLTFFYILIVFQ